MDLINLSPSMCDKFDDIIEIKITKIGSFEYRILVKSPNLWRIYVTHRPNAQLLRIWVKKRVWELGGGEFFKRKEKKQHCTVFLIKEQNVMNKF